MGSTATSETGETWVKLSTYELSDKVTVTNQNSAPIEYRRIDAQGGDGVITGNCSISFDNIKNLNYIEIRRYDQDDESVSVDWTNVYYGMAGITTTAAVDFASMATGTEDTKTVAVGGAIAANNAPVYLGWSASLEAGIVVAQAWVSADDTVSIRVRNVSSDTIDPASIVCRVMVARI